jgi:hypothetical protein
MTKKTRAKTGAHGLLASFRLQFWGSFIVLCLVPFYVFPHDLTLMGGMTNFTSDRTLTAMPPGINDQVTNVAGYARLSGDFMQNISYELDLGMDAVWQYYLMGDAVFRYNAFKFGFGTFFQYSEAGKEFLNPSMIINLGIEFPGAFFADFKTILSFYENLVKTGNFAYSYLAYAIGYWTQNLIAGIYFDSREFEERRTDTLLVRDSLTRYFFHAGIYDKNRMFTVNLDLGYEVLEFEMTETERDIAKAEAFFAGLEFIIQISNGLSWHIKGEIPYPFSYPSNFFWYTVMTGITIKLVD